MPKIPEYAKPYVAYSPSRKRIKVGMLLEVTLLNKKVGYFQVVRYDVGYGWLLRILPGRFNSRLATPELDVLVSKKEEHYIFVDPITGLAFGMLEVMGEGPVPDKFTKEVPRMKVPFGPPGKCRWRWYNGVSISTDELLIPENQNPSEIAVPIVAGYGWPLVMDRIQNEPSVWPTDWA